jgi:hypothetical protein
MQILVALKRALFLSLPFSFLPISALAQEAPITADGTTATEISNPDGNNFDINGGDRAEEIFFTVLAIFLFLMVVRLIFLILLIFSISLIG